MAAKKLTRRLPMIPEEKLTPRQREVMEAIRSGPRGKVSQDGPFGVYLHSPEIGDLIQALGAHCRHKTSLPPRLSELAILCTARQWQAQYEWFVHAPIAEKAGVPAATIADLRAGRAPKRMKKDERAIFDLVRELYKTRRVSERTYKRAQALFGDAGMVDLMGILGYYGLVAMMLNVFQMQPPPETPQAFKEPGAK
jgi:4-carboxymuconolactone decarboxylase